MGRIIKILSKSYLWGVDILILVTTGTSEYRFTRLFDIINEFCKNGVLKGKDVIVQTGEDKYESKYFKSFSMISNEEFNKLVDQAEFIISHAGTGSVVPALKKNKKVIIFPRLHEFNEHIDNHQLELAELFLSKKYVMCAMNKKELCECIKKINAFTPNKFKSNNLEMNNLIKEFIENERENNMKDLKIYYAKADNMGDMLNKDIIEKCFGYKAIRRTYLTGAISGIGSGLGNYMYDDCKWKNILKFLSSIFYPKAYVWSMGFISNKENDGKIYKKNIKFCSVRGELSKKRIEKILGNKLDISTGDAGLLSSYLIANKHIEKKYDVGIIAHFREKDEPFFEKLKDKIPNSVIIDVQDTPLNVINKIAECNSIVSSSLHGLIISDSLRVPNVHVVVTNKMLGDGFKFNDYYSCFGIEHKYILAKDFNTINNSKDIKKLYKITDEMIEKKQKEIIEAFPFKSYGMIKNDK